MPWRTGTAVNPLLRALYLLRHQNEMRLSQKSSLLNSLVDDEVEEGVALFMPWLDSSEDREKLYGNTSFPDGIEGMQKQEVWIQNYAGERCGMAKEAEQLTLVFYPAFYLEGFGSIFPKVDLCNFAAARGYGDVAILEEPEHLNWFRMPDINDEGDSASLGKLATKRVEEETPRAPNGVFGQKVEVLIDDTLESTDLTAEAGAVGQCIDLPREESGHAQQSAQHSTEIMQATKLGWTHRFRFVVGIVHTNYEAYARQYGVGASLIAAPAIGAMNALTIRAHCHQVIKLSDTLPSFAPGKEVTCNVHGVRREFLEGLDLDLVCGQKKEDSEEAEEEASPVYFIGKLVWAKGFDLMLNLQDVYRKKYGEYFSIDIYGGGPEQKEIARAFHGRNHCQPDQRPAKKEAPATAVPKGPKDMSAAVMSNPVSIKEQSAEVIEKMRRHKLSDHDDNVVLQYLSLGFEVSSHARDEVTYVRESRDDLAASNSSNPLEIMGDLGGQSIDTTIQTSKAVYNIADASIKNILHMSFSQLQNRDKNNKPTDSTEKTKEEDALKFVFDPPASRFEWRRHPVPARFPGVVDHACLKNTLHKIFLNPSTSEVLCTASAEALAMNKFVILPEHPSNHFFLPFANCLSYRTLQECAERLRWALAHDPVPLPEEERRKLTWEAATERLLESSLVSVVQAKDRAESGMDKTDARIAYWLNESGEKGNMLRGLFHKDGGHSPVAQR